MGTRNKVVGGGDYLSQPSILKVRKTWRSTSTAATRLYEMAYTTGENYLYQFNININPTNQVTKSMERRPENSCTSLSIAFWTVDIVQCRTSIKDKNFVKPVKNKYVPLLVIRFATGMSYCIQSPFLPLRTRLGE